MQNFRFALLCRFRALFEHSLFPDKDTNKRVKLYQARLDIYGRVQYIFNVYIKNMQNIISALTDITRTIRVYWIFFSFFSKKCVFFFLLSLVGSCVRVVYRGASASFEHLFGNIFLGYYSERFKVFQFFHNVAVALV